MKFLNSKQKKAIIRDLNETYGITQLNAQLIEVGKKRLRAFTGNLSREEIEKLFKIANIETIGMYIISQKDNDLRLNFDALPLFKDQITKRIVEIKKDQLALWIRGYDLDIKCKKGITILKFEDEFVGIGKSNGEKIFNYLPKERKIKTPLPSQPHISN